MLCVCRVDDEVREGGLCACMGTLEIGDKERNSAARIAVIGDGLDGLPIDDQRHRCAFGGDFDMIHLAFGINDAAIGVVDQNSSSAVACCVNHTFEDGIGTVAIDFKAIVGCQIGILIGGTANVDAVAVILITLGEFSMHREVEVAKCPVAGQ